MPEIGIISSREDLVVEWQIGNFFTLSDRDGAWYTSPSFSFGGEKWCLLIFPNGWIQCGSSGYIDLCLDKYSPDRSIKKDFSLCLKTDKGEKYNEDYCSKLFGKSYSEEHFTKEFDDDEFYHEFVRFIPRSELTRRKSDLVPDGVLTVICTMKNMPSAGSATEKSENIYVETSTQTGEENGDEWFKENARNACVEASTQTAEQSEDLKKLSITELNKANTPEVIGSDEAEASGSNQTGATESKKSVSPVNLPEEHECVTNVRDFLEEGIGVDVTFELETPSGKTEFIAHQLILALRSSYFADAFYGTEMNNGHLRIFLKGIDPKAFEQMIRYCYDYKPCLRTTEDACALFKVAFEFKVLSLQKLCRTFIRDSKIEARNVFSVLEVSEMMEDKSLGDMCNKILQDKTRDVLATYELCNVTPVMVHTFLNLSNLSLNSEYELIKWIFDWAKVKTEDEDSSSENAREYLERFLKDLNFLTLTNEQFALLCKENLHFFSSDEMASIHQNIACPGTRQMPAWYNNDVKCRVYTDSKE